MIQISGPLSPEKELERLREAYDALNDVSRGVETALADIELMNFGNAKDQLKAVQWHVEQVKKKITAVGQNRNQTLTTQNNFRIQNVFILQDSNFDGITQLEPPRH